VTTDSDDTTGRVLATSDAAIDEAAVRAAATAFVGAIDQRAPAVSAIKQGGEALYRKARRGEAVTAPVRQVRIASLIVERVDPGARTVDFVLTCSAGTYVRSLARDWGDALGVGGALSRLRRLAIGPHRVEGAIPTAELTERPEGSIPEWNARLAAAGFTPEQALSALPALVLDAAEAKAVGTGRAPSRRRALDAGIAAGCPAFRLVDGEGALVGVGALAAAAAPEDPFELRLVWAARETLAP
jgi:tRNA pseudouridine55 synthase